MLNQKKLAILLFFHSLLIISIGLNKGMGQMVKKETSPNNNDRFIYPHKVFVHTDKNNYNTEEHIWFNIYVLDGKTLKPDTLSTNAYVDIVDAHGNVVFNSILKLNNGVASGDIFLPDTLTDGNYMMAAYTDWSRGLLEKNVFTKNFYVSNPDEKNYISRRQVRKNRKFNNQLEKWRTTYNYEIFPESGTFIPNKKNKAVIRAANYLNENISTNGAVYDNSDNKVAEIIEVIEGYGYFELTPDLNARYYAKLSLPGDETAKIRIAPSEIQACGIRVNESNNKLEIEIRGNCQKQDKLKLISQYSLDTILNTDVVAGKSYSFSGDIFPGGVNRFILADANDNIISERLFFIRSEKEALDISFFNRPFFSEDNENINIPIRFSNNNKPVSGTFSFTIHNISDCDDMSSIIQTENIVEHLYLYSDVKKAQYYYENIDLSDNHDIERLNKLLIAHQWKWSIDKKSFAEKLALKDIYFPDSLVLTGQLVSRDDRPILAGHISVVMSDREGIVRFADLERNTFRFTGLYYENAFKANLRIEARRNLGRHVGIVVAMNPFDNPDYIFSPFTKDQQITERGPEWTNINPWYKRLFSHSVDASSRQRASYHSPDQIIYVEDLTDRHHTNMINILRGHVTGLQVDHTGRMQFRGQSSFALSNEPLLMIDGIIVDRHFFMNMNINDLERIEIYRGPSASTFGARGTNGVIAAFTKRSHLLPETTIEFTLAGYHTENEFSMSSAFDDENMLIPCRTLLYEPSLKIENTNNMIIQIPGQLPKGDYIIVIQGIDKNGVPGYGKLKFSID